MSVRISVLNDDGRLTIRIEGRLHADDAAAIREDHGASAAESTLDLSGLLSADDAALEILLALEAAGAVLSGASTYVRYLLETVRCSTASLSDLTTPLR